MNAMIQIKRIYKPPSPDDGTRFWVDRFWPRGISKEKRRIDAWLKDAAPSTGLREWFHHEPDKWEEFLRRYFAERDGNPPSWEPIMDASQRGNATLLYAARDMERNNAVALKAYPDRHLQQEKG